MQIKAPVSCAHAQWRNSQWRAFDAIRGRTVINLAVHKKGKILTSRGAAARAAAYLAQVGAKALYPLGETLGKVMTVEAVTMVTMVTIQASKTATADDVKDLSLQIAPRRMRKGKWRQISKTS